MATGKLIHISSQSLQNPTAAKCLHRCLSSTTAPLRRGAGAPAPRQYSPFGRPSQRSSFRHHAIQMDLPLISMDARPLYDIYIKGSPEKGEVGDCPFSHRTMLHLEEKGVPYNKMLLDEQNMPDWIKEVSEGQKKIPFMLELDTGKWLHDSDKMVPYIEKKYPSPKLGLPEDSPPVGQNLMPTCLIEFLTSKPGEEEKQKQKQLEDELAGINDYLEKHGPFFGGENITTHDLTLGPKLKHTIIATKTIKGYELPKEYTAIHRFMDKISQRQSWKNTLYTEKYVQDGWKLKVKLLTEG